MAGALDWLDPGVERFVLSDAPEDREQVRHEVRRHWAAGAAPAARIGLALICFSTAWLLGGIWLLLLIALAGGLAAQALWRLAGHHRDRFVITDRRVFRVHGNLNQERAGLPLSGISGVEPEQSWLGRLLGYGKLRLAAAANDQGLTEVRWIPDPAGCAEEIRAGARAAAERAVAGARP